MHTIKNVRLEINNQKILVLKFFFVKYIGLINDAKPKTSRIFDILHQLHFPMRDLVIYQEQH